MEVDRVAPKNVRLPDAPQLDAGEAQHRRSARGAHVRTVAGLVVVTRLTRRAKHIPVAVSARERRGVRRLGVAGGALHDDTAREEPHFALPCVIGLMGMRRRRREI